MQGIRLSKQMDQTSSIDAYATECLWKKLLLYVSGNIWSELGNKKGRTYLWNISGFMSRKSQI